MKKQFGANQRVAEAPPREREVESVIQPRVVFLEPYLRRVIIPSNNVKALHRAAAQVISERHRARRSRESRARVEKILFPLLGRKKLRAGRSFKKRESIVCCWKIHPSFHTSFHPSSIHPPSVICPFIHQPSIHCCSIELRGVLLNTGVYFIRVHRCAKAQPGTGTEDQH